MAVTVDPYIDCRPGNDLHAWFWFPNHKQAPRGYTYRVRRCERCATIRTGLVHLSTGQLEGSYTYEHPADWKFYEKGTRPSAAEFRRISIRRERRQEVKVPDASITQEPKV